MSTEVTAIATRPAPSASDGEMTIEQIVSQTRKIQQCMQLVMKDGEHYGVIPGTGNRKDAEGKPIPPKPTLLKPGAEKLCLLFRLDPQYDVIDKTETASLIRFTIRCTVYHIPTGVRVASGLGSCNSNEDKYLRPADKRCPKCDKTAIKKSKYPPREQPSAEPGWYCFGKIGGCGANFAADDKEITEQDNGIKDPADLHNTILKMACKRALIAAVLNATAASDFFTQDLEDLTEKAAEYIPPTDNLKEKLEASVATAATPTVAAAGGTAAASASSSSSSASADIGEAATDAQKEALRLHIRKKAWKAGFARIWFAGLFGPLFAQGDPLEKLSCRQADAAFTLLLAHGNESYRKIRMELADEGSVLRDENDITF